MAASIGYVLNAYARIATAVAPCLAALVVRLIFGKNRVTHTLLSISTTWFAINLLLAPFSAELRRELNNIYEALR